MKLAIIIPYFKIDFFEKTLESLAQQTDQRFQVYIGDDASPVPPTELIEKYQGKFNFTYKRFDDNLGSISLTKQWERCIAMMQEEEWFMILGDDDVLGQKVVEVFNLHLKEASEISNVIRFSTQIIDENSQPISKIWQQPNLENALVSYFRKINGQNRSSLSEFIFRTEKHAQYKFRNFPLAWCSDDFAVIDFSENKPIFSLNEEIVYVRMSESNISGLQDNLDQKIIAHQQSDMVLFKEYVGQIPTKEREDMIKRYDQKIMGASYINLKDFLHLQYLTIRYVGFKLVFQQWKTFIYKLLFNKRTS